MLGKFKTRFQKIKFFELQTVLLRRGNRQNRDITNNRILDQSANKDDIEAGAANPPDIQTRTPQSKLFTETNKGETEPCPSTSTGSNGGGCRTPKFGQRQALWKRSLEGQSNKSDGCKIFWLENASKAVQPNNACQDSQTDESGQEAEAQLENQQPSNAEQDQYETSTGFSRSFLQTHFDLMFFMGLSPIRASKSSHAEIHWVRYIVTISMGVFASFGFLKTFIITSVEAGNLFHYISILYLIGTILLQLYIFKLAVWNSECISKILRRTPSHQSSTLSNNGNNGIKIAPWSLIYALIVILMSFARAIRLDSIIEGSTLKGVLLSRSELVARHLFLWIKDGDKNGTTYADLLFLQYGEELSGKTLTMGIFGVVMMFVLSMQKHFIRDMLLMVALNMFDMSKKYYSSIMKCINERGDICADFSTMRELTDDISTTLNEIEFGFENLYKVIHVDNLLFCSYFMLDMLRGDTDDLYFVESLIIIPKILSAYYISAKISSVAPSIKNAVVEKYYSAEYSGVERENAKIFLKRLQICPIGIGRGQFEMDESFALKFVGVVVSCFLLFADSDKENSCGGGS